MGQTHTDKNVSFTYDSAGTYPVSLIVTNGGCSDTAKTNVVVIKEQGKMEVANPVSCINTNINFAISNIHPANIRNYTWFFNGLTQPPSLFRLIRQLPYIPHLALTRLLRLSLIS